MFGKHTEYLNDLLKNPITNELIQESLSTYPLYTPQKTYDLIPTREELNTRLLNHYKYQEIGFETVGRFIDELKITMCEIMPYYNEMFKTVETMAELPSPFDNVDVIEKYEEERTSEMSSESTGNETSTSTSTENSKSDVDAIDEQAYKKVNAGTPQSSLSETGDLMEEIKYADNVEWYKANNSAFNETTNETTAEGTAERESNAETKGTSKDKITHTFTKTGNQGVNTYAHDMNEFRTSIIDVVNQIINDERVQMLFMLVY